MLKWNFNLCDVTVMSLPFGVSQRRPLYPRAPTSCPMTGSAHQRTSPARPPAHVSEDEPSPVRARVTAHVGGTRVKPAGVDEDAFHLMAPTSPGTRFSSPA